MDDKPGENPLIPCAACGVLLDPPLLPASAHPNIPQLPICVKCESRPSFFAHNEDGEKGGEDGEEEGEPLALDFTVEGCDDVCCCCGGGGNLLLCDGCPAAFCNACLEGIGTLACALVRPGQRCHPTARYGAASATCAHTKGASKFTTQTVCLRLDPSLLVANP